MNVPIPQGEDDAIIADQWYYSVEVKKGFFTNGHQHKNVALIRSLLRTVAFQGCDCLDIGSQEAIIPILLRKGGAGRVVAYDRNDLSAKIGLLQRLYDVGFDYVSGLQLQDLPARLDAGGGRFFDLVVFSGILHHMINPLGLLATVRGFCKPGGLLVIETPAIQHLEPNLLFNAKGKRYGKGSNYFVPTTAWLDYILRFVGLRPLSISHLPDGNPAVIHRVAVLCRSESTPCPLDNDDQWARAPFHEKIFSSESQVDWSGLRATQSRIGMHGGGTPITGSIYDAIRDTPPQRYATDDLRLIFNSSI